MELIDRQALLSMIPTIEDEYKEARRIIQSMPTIDAVKHGAWVPVDWKEPRRYGCSECHRLVWQLENYCPNCGARMDGEE